MPDSLTVEEPKPLTEADAHPIAEANADGYSYADVLASIVASVDPHIYTDGLIVADACGHRGRYADAFAHGYTYFAKHGHRLGWPGTDRRIAVVDRRKRS